MFTVLSLELRLEEEEGGGGKLEIGFGFVAEEGEEQLVVAVVVVEVVGCITVSSCCFNATKEALEPPSHRIGVMGGEKKGQGGE